MFEIYTFWNASSVISVLNGIVLVMGGSDWTGLMKSIVILGFLISLGVGLLKMTVKEPVQYLLIVAMLHGVLFLPKVTATVRDVRSGEVGTVANVPLGVAFIASTTSQIGKFLTDTFETNLVASDELRFSRTGLSWGANALSSLAAARPASPRLMDAAQAFVRNCVSPEVTADMDKYNQLINSTNIMGLLASGRGTAAGWLNPGRVATVPLATGAGTEVLPCITASAPGSAYDRVADLLAAEVPTVRTKLAAALLPDITPATANTLLGTYLPGVEGALIGASRNASEMISQAMAVNMVADSAGTLAMVRNDPAAAQMAIGSTLATAQSASSYRLLGMIGAEALPKFRNVLELILIAIFPIAMLMALLGGDRGGAAVRTYAMALGSVQLWAPIYAIVNTVLTPMTAARLKAAAGGGISQTMLNSEGLIYVGLTEQAIAGALVMAVPMISWAVVSGGAQAVGGAMGSLMAPSSQAAGSVGASTAMGNFQMGNTAFGSHSMNTVSASKFDTSPSHSSGRISMTSGLSHTNFDGNTGARVVNNSAQRADMGPWSATAADTARSTLSTMATVASSRANEAAGTFASAAGQAYNQMLRNLQGSSTGSTLTAGAAVSDSGQMSQAASSGISAVRQLAQRHGLSEEQAFAAALSGHLGVEAPKLFGLNPVKAGAELSANSTSKGSSSRINEEAKQLGNSDDFKALVQHMRQGQVGSSATNTATAGQTREAGADASLRQATEAAEQYRTATAQQEQYTQGASRAASRDQSFMSDMGNKVDQWLRANGSAGLEEMGRMATNPDPQARAHADGRIAQAVQAVMSQSAGGSGFTVTPAAPPAPYPQPSQPDAKTSAAGGGGGLANTGAPGASPNAQAPSAPAAPPAPPQPMVMPSLDGLAMPTGLNGAPLNPAALQASASAAGQVAQDKVDGGRSAVRAGFESNVDSLAAPGGPGGLRVSDGAGGVITAAGVFNEARGRLGEAQAGTADAAGRLGETQYQMGTERESAVKLGDNPASQGVSRVGQALGGGVAAVTDPVIRTWKRAGEARGTSDVDPSSPSQAAPAP